MSINQVAIVEMIKACGEPVQTKGRKVWICDEANMMTAMNYFKKITGQEFNFLSLPTVASGFKLKTISEEVAGVLVKVTLRGGSSSAVVVRNKDKHQGPPTFEINGAEALTLVPYFDLFPADTTVEVKFTTRAEFARWENLYVSPGAVN